MNAILFKESQYMTGGWILVAVIALLVLVAGSRFRRMVRLQKAASVITLIIMLVTLTIMLTLHLDTVYYPRRIEHRFASLFGTGYDIVSLDSVTQVKVLTYDPADYGGWGVKGNGTTQVFNASGNTGILFTFRSGRQLLLGTNQPDTLRQRLENYYPF